MFENIERDEQQQEHVHQHDSGCECSSDHGNPMDDTHGHSGERRHKHAHNHSAGCDCECKQKHADYSHDNAHTNAHHHAHEHGHHHVELKPGVVNVQNHEGAMVATLQEQLSGDFLSAEDLTSKWLASIATQVVAQGGVIGHIKASLASGNSSCTLSTTGVDAVHVSRGGSVQGTMSSVQASANDTQPGTGLTLVAIVFNVDAERLREIVLACKPL